MKVTFKIEGIRCMSCWNHITQILNNPAIVQTSISHATGWVDMYFLEDTSIFASIKNKIEDAGYQVKFIWIAEEE